MPYGRMTVVVVGMVAAAVVALGAQQQPQSSGAIRLIVQGDDMGVAHGFNVATLQAYREGIMRTANVIMPSAWVPEAARMLNANPDLDAGIHLTLTSEWQTVRWRPLTAAPSLVDEQGYMFRSVRSRDDNGRENKRDLGEIERELRAQIELGKSMIPHVSYMSAHMGFTSFSPEVAALVERLSKEYGLVRREQLDIRSIGRVWDPSDGPDVRGEKLAARLATLEPGTWLMLDHCATDTPEIQAISSRVAFDRSGVVAAWTHPKVIETVKTRGIELTHYRNLLGRR